MLHLVGLSTQNEIFVTNSKPRHEPQAVLTSALREGVWIGNSRIEGWARPTAGAGPNGLKELPALPGNQTFVVQSLISHCNDEALPA